MKSETKSPQNRRSERARKPYLSYIVQFDELNRSKRVAESHNSLKFSQTQILQNVNVNISKLKASKIKVEN